jgi:KDO2-lipid IV(A) lauroyltransferase
MASQSLKKISHVVEFVLFLLLGSIVRLFPRRYLPRIAKTLVKNLRWLLVPRWRVAMRNLQNAFPEKKMKELRTIAAQSFESIATAFLELLWLPNFTQRSLCETVIIENPEILNEAVQKGKGLILMSAHFGNWEIGAQRTALQLSVPLYFIVKGQANDYVDRVINRWREKFGAHTVPMGISIREILRALQNGYVVGMASDQAAAKESVAVNFFGREVPTFQGPAMFALRTHAPMMMGLAVRQMDGTYQLRFHRVPSDDLDGVTDANIKELTRRHVELTEKLIREHPEQWMWMHKRWKHVPDRIPIKETE